MSCIDKILEFYENAEMINSIRGKIWFSQILVRLMTELDEGHTNFLEVRNCLILLLNLASNTEAPDLYQNKGKDSGDLSDNEKQDLYELLQSELNRETNN